MRVELNTNALAQPFLPLFTGEVSRRDEGGFSIRHSSAVISCKHATPSVRYADTSLVTGRGIPGLLRG